MMKVEISEDTIIEAIAYNYNIAECDVNLEYYTNQQILESLEAYIKLRNGKLL